jgi:hypothetical protein
MTTRKALQNSPIRLIQKRQKINMKWCEIIDLFLFCGLPNYKFIQQKRGRERERKEKTMGMKHPTHPSNKE